MKWVLYALLAAVSFATIMIIMRLLTDMRTPANVIVGGMFGFAALFAVPTFITYGRVSSSWKGILATALVGVVSYTANVQQVLSIGEAPNPGLTASIISTQVLLVTLISLRMFRSTLSRSKICGVLLIITGIVCISM